MSYFFRWIASFWSRDVESRLEDDWVAIASNDETHLALVQTEEVSKELEEIRSNTVFDRRQVFVTIKELMSSLTKIQSTKLPPDVRKGIFRDVFTKASPRWIDEIESLLPVSLKQLWYPSQYEKQILGLIIDMAERSSPEQLTTAGIVQVVKGVHLCLVQSLNNLLEETMERQVSRQLLTLVIESIEPLLELWLKMVKITERSLQRQGSLPSRWKKEERERQQVDVQFRYADGDPDPIRKTRFTGEKPKLLDKETMERRKEKVAASLLFVPKTFTPEVRGEEFTKRRERISDLLATRRTHLRSSRDEKNASPIFSRRETLTR